MELDKTIFFDKDRIAEFENCLSAIYKSAKDERSKLWEINIDLQAEYTVFSELEILSTDICGYISQIAWRGYTRQEPHQVINHLRQLRIFEVKCIVDWYCSSSQEYPKIKQYFELLDYLRLLTIEYTQLHRLEEPQIFSPLQNYSRTMSQSEAKHFDQQRLAELLQRLKVLEPSAQKDAHQFEQFEQQIAQPEYSFWQLLDLLVSYSEINFIIAANITLNKAKLQKLLEGFYHNRPFANERIINWYQSIAKGYPHLKQYIELLDYIRLLTIEYIEKY